MRKTGKLNKMNKTWKRLSWINYLIYSVIIFLVSGLILHVWVKFLPSLTEASIFLIENMIGREYIKNKHLGKEINSSDVIWFEEVIGKITQRRHTFFDLIKANERHQKGLPIASRPIGWMCWFLPIWLQYIWVAVLTKESVCYIIIWNQNKRLT